MQDELCHVVRVDRRTQFSSATLPAEAQSHLQEAFRAGSWFGDRWARRRFREQALHTQKADAPGGLVVIGPALGIEPPPPFAEQFEPMALSDTFAGDLERLKVLSGPKPTRQERVARYVWSSLALILIAASAAFIVGFVRGLPTRLLPILAGVALLIAAGVVLALAIRRLGGRWFLVPSGVAIVGGIARRRGEVTLLTRRDGVALMRLVSTGKTTVLVLEIVTHQGKRYRHSVSERQALGFLAAWQSPQSPPTPEQLSELAGAEPTGSRAADK